MANDGSGATTFTSPSLPTSAETAYVWQLARSGSLPADPANLRRMLSVAPAEVERYDEEIRTFRGLGDQHASRLLSERDTLVSYTAFCRSVLSPAQKLPNELLAKIFDLYFHETLHPGTGAITLEDQMQFFTRRALQELAQVCFRWYCVAIGTPQLWSTIIIHSDVWDRSFVYPEILTKLLASLLIRGKDYPLIIEMSIYPTMHCKRVLALLCRHARRWRKAHFWSIPQSQTFFHPTKNLKLDRLVSLSLDVESESWKDITAFQNSPFLTELTVARFHKLPILPWPQIKTVTYNSLGDGNPVRSALSVLRTAINMSICTLLLDLRRYDPNSESWGIHTTSRTQELYIQLMTSAGNDNDPVLGRFLDSLTLPRLTVLDIHPDDGGGVGVGVFPPLWSAAAFLDLADRSGFNNSTSLTSLALYVQVTDVELLHCLSAVPQLEKLELRDCVPAAVTDTFLRGLQLHGSTPLVPHLGLFSICCGLDFDDSTWVDLLASRRRVHSGQNRPFKAKLWWYEPRTRAVSSEALERIAQLVSEGGLVFDSGAYVSGIHG
ncbi:hypothetical protein R3P38DRAFT_3003977 [Favolaschia claudopus]|uniref:F-box domain-containing protein n=1 Tax=Favolaschia claudopus TaxID=2862362 RepID=A0AAW0AL59_9AGAR